MADALAGTLILNRVTGKTYALTGEYRRPRAGEDYLAIKSGHVYTQPVHAEGMEPSAAPILVPTAMSSLLVLERPHIDALREGAAKALRAADLILAGHPPADPEASRLLAEAREALNG